MNFRKLLLFFTAITIFGSGFFVGRSSRPLSDEIPGIVLQDFTKPQNIDFSIFWDTWNLLERKAFSKNFDRQEMVYGAISGMVRSLGDPYTVFMPPDEAKKFEEDISGFFDGIGAEIGMRKGQLVIIAPLEGTPADLAGLRPGDKILKIDDEDTIELTLDQAVSRIRGKGGTKVTLLILRDDWDASQPITIVRGVIEIPTLKLEFKENDIAYIKLSHFNEKASRDFSDAVQKIKKQNAKKLILDLRSNPGGFLEVAQEIAGWFIERGGIVTIEDFGGKRSNVEYRSAGDASFASMPSILIVNEGSASASEILAGALRDHLGTILVGAKTFGKGSVQELEKLRDGSAVKVTVAKWLTPHGTLINDKGLEPDVAVELTSKDIDNNKDPQLEKALELLQKQ
jgi:carboxyl-terminal processing protease